MHHVVQITGDGRTGCYSAPTCREFTQFVGIAHGGLHHPSWVHLGQTFGAANVNRTPNCHGLQTRSIDNWEMPLVDGKKDMHVLQGLCLPSRFGPTTCLSGTGLLSSQSLVLGWCGAGLARFGLPFCCWGWRSRFFLGFLRFFYFRFLCILFQLLILAVLFFSFIRRLLLFVGLPVSFDTIDTNLIPFYASIALRKGSSFDAPHFSFGARVARRS
mmetsp:Transcript_13931/g.21155  ORF Transcript_13931/g.21155 Transcript_13931/m.21155 type:complete len:215 (-) Transcript_13931:305-949(-)